MHCRLPSPHTGALADTVWSTHVTKQQPAPGILIKRRRRRAPGAMAAPLASGLPTAKGQYLTESEIVHGTYNPVNRITPIHTSNICRPLWRMGGQRSSRQPPPRAGGRPIEPCPSEHADQGKNDIQVTTCREGRCCASESRCHCWPILPALSGHFRRAFLLSIRERLCVRGRTITVSDYVLWIRQEQVAGWG